MINVAKRMFIQKAVSYHAYDWKTRTSPMHWRSNISRRQLGTIQQGSNVPTLLVWIRVYLFFLIFTFSYSLAYFPHLICYSQPWNFTLELVHRRMSNTQQIFLKIFIVLFAQTFSFILLFSSFSLRAHTFPMWFVCVRRVECVYVYYEIVIAFHPWRAKERVRRKKKHCLMWVVREKRDILLFSINTAITTEIEKDSSILRYIGVNMIQLRKLISNIFHIFYKYICIYIVYRCVFSCVCSDRLPIFSYPNFHIFVICWPYGRRSIWAVLALLHLHFLIVHSWKQDQLYT